jgi:Ca2+:H+ antiporter
MIAFTFFDFYVIGPVYGYSGIANKGFIFAGSILSTVPLAYFIGMAVSSVTAQTGSIAIGSVINATFGSIIEVILYIISLLQGKEELVQGAMIGSFLLGLLALPGVSMFFGGIRKKEQRFNAKSAGVTSTMLLIATIGVFTPTLFQNVAYL